MKGYAELAAKLQDDLIVARKSIEHIDRLLSANAARVLTDHETLVAIGREMMRYAKETKS